MTEDSSSFPRGIKLGKEKKKDWKLKAEWKPALKQKNVKSGSGALRLRAQRNSVLIQHHQLYLENTPWLVSYTVLRSLSSRVNGKRMILSTDSVVLSALI